MGATLEGLDIGLEAVGVEQGVMWMEGKAGWTLCVSQLPMEPWITL